MKLRATIQFDHNPKTYAEAAQFEALVKDLAKRVATEIGMSGEPIVLVNERRERAESPPTVRRRIRRSMEAETV